MKKTACMRSPLSKPLIAMLGSFSVRFRRLAQRVKSARAYYMSGRSVYRPNFNAKIRLVWFRSHNQRGSSSHRKLVLLKRAVERCSFPISFARESSSLFPHFESQVVADQALDYFSPRSVDGFPYNREWKV